MAEQPARTVRLVLVTADGRPIGQLPLFPVATPWWADVEPVVRAARERFGADVIVLRLLDAERPEQPGGSVTYVAELRGDARPNGLAPWLGALNDDPLRLPWATPGGPDMDVAWADDVLATHDMRRTAPAEQIKTWNLSSLWRLPLGNGNAWLKHVPPFLAHEGPLIERLADDRVPVLLGRDAGRSLMAELPGEDLFGAPLPLLERMVAILVDLQRAWIDRTAELEAIGLPDWRSNALTAAIDGLVERTAPELTTREVTSLRRFVADLPARFDALAAAGLPDTLVHGDFHPGNFRGDATKIVLLDWGDSGVGHPLLDEAAFLDRIRPDDVNTVRHRWHDLWREAIPGSEPDRAAVLLAPVGAARQAMIYRTFLDTIEHTEQPYHAADPARWLRRTAGIVEREGPLSRV